MLLLLLLLPVLSAGCGLYGNDRADLLAARQTYAGVTNAVATVRERGAFTVSEGRAVKETSAAALKALDRWQAELELSEQMGRAVNTGAVTAMFVDEFRALLREMCAAQIAAQRYIDSRPVPPKVDPKEYE
ncbi:MAG: hypothetical protein PHU85_03070 [Phycisphaerae bacterium]|nr:hypothetical protein [Phycisphaerae bacterium]